MFKLLTQGLMGCVCERESLRVEDRNFYVRSRLGEGGFSYVDLVEDVTTKKYFALKTISCYSKDDEKIALKEVDYMKEFSHPNLIACEVAAVVAAEHSSRSITGQVYIVMPFYPRGTVQDELERLSQSGGHMREERVCHVMRGVCEGLRALHNHQPPLAHRDVKPHNVLLGDDDTPVLMDFGSMAEARQTVENTKQARALQDQAAERCSMPYRAPELFQVEVNSDVTEATDIWSLGCLLYALCYLESPFDPAFKRGDSVALAAINGLRGLPDQDHFSQAVQKFCRVHCHTIDERTWCHVLQAGYFALGVHSFIHHHRVVLHTRDVLGIPRSHAPLRLDVLAQVLRHELAASPMSVLLCQAHDTFKFFKDFVEDGYVWPGSTTPLPDPPKWLV